jgi:hypothetical protein
MEPAGARFVNAISFCAARSSPGLCTASRPPHQPIPGNRELHGLNLRPEPLGDGHVNAMKSPTNPGGNNGM